MLYVTKITLNFVRKVVIRMQAYCVKCRKKVDIQNPEQVTMKNGKPATRGKCPICGTGVYRIGSAKKAKSDE